MTKPTIICLTPVKNEAWILNRFLKCASVWADHILVLDQGSDDGSKNIAKSFSKVTLLENPSARFNEPERQKILIDAARKIPGKRLLIALDADEFITSNFLNSTEWETILNAPPGTTIRFQWAIILEGIETYWIYPHPMPLGFMDDNSPHIGKKIHSPRLPIHTNKPEIHLKNIKIMHYVDVDPIRRKSRLRWYMCWALLNQNETNPIEIYRFHYKTIIIPSNMVYSMPKDWLEGYEKLGIDMTSVVKEKKFRWDKQVLDFFIRYGPNTFKKLDVWDVNWSKLYGELYSNQSKQVIKAPRRTLDKYIIRYLRRTQKYYGHFSKPKPLSVRIFDKLFLKLLGIMNW